MYLISRLSKVHKSQEDIAAIQDYMSQLQQFHAPYEILKELCYSMNYKSFKHGEHVKNKSEYAYFILKGQILADNGDIDHSKEKKRPIYIFLQFNSCRSCIEVGKILRMLFKTRYLTFFSVCTGANHNFSLLPVEEQLLEMNL